MRKFREGDKVYVLSWDYISSISIINIENEAELDNVMHLNPANSLMPYECVSTVERNYSQLIALSNDYSYSKNAVLGGDIEDDTIYNNLLLPYLDEEV